jgi:hypothetical protein
MTYKLLEYDYPSFRCDECDLIVAGNETTKHLWARLEREGWLRIGKNGNLCRRCVEQQEKLPPWENTPGSAAEAEPPHRGPSGDNLGQSTLCGSNRRKQSEGTRQGPRASAPDANELPLAEEDERWH